MGSLLLGGVTLAIPPDPGPLLAPGQRLPLHERPDPEWLQWVPFLALNSDPERVEPGRPRPLAVELSWQFKEYWTWTRDGRRRGWGLPLAEGLLVVCIGRATKIARFLSGQDKTYEAEIHLGISSPTFDSEGVPPEPKPADIADLTPSEIESLLDNGND